MAYLWMIYLLKMVMFHGYVKWMCDCQWKSEKYDDTPEILIAHVPWGGYEQKGRIVCCTPIDKK